MDKNRAADREGEKKRHGIYEKKSNWDLGGDGQMKFRDCLDMLWFLLVSQWWIHDFNQVKDRIFLYVKRDVQWSVFYDTPGILG